MTRFLGNEALTSLNPLIAEPRFRQVTLAEKRAFLESGQAWPGEPPPRCIETQSSLAFLTRDRVWKLKKPVRFSHIDLRALVDRKGFCEEEVRLNRQLSGSLYRGVTPLVQRCDGTLALGGAGQAVDWLVESIRMPANAMLDVRLRQGPPPDLEDILAISDLLIAFYRSRPTVPSDGAVYYHRLLQDSRLNAQNLREMQRELPVPPSDEVLQSGTEALKLCRAEILARARRGLIFEGHGDLRAEHVSLADRSVVFDRMEFDHGSRLVDPYEEFNTLGLECALAGAGWIRPVMFLRLAYAGFAAPGCALLAAYGINRCLTLARLAIDHFRDRDMSSPAKWRDRARFHFDAAVALTERFQSFRDCAPGQDG
ncbi:hypothetical protein PVW46_15315 [Mameliella sp. AT18]|uniref:hypothetical protein n=1 Tax=Mameliella sp. AT18 TaxID=3028385 RepID=UPI00237BD22E|nr:hypothetical protein [Mameliella sp. AT18]MDD9731278.1 hypothetical protein [Mameliella sp. AT18]